MLKEQKDNGEALCTPDLLFEGTRLTIRSGPVWVGWWWMLWVYAWLMGGTLALTTARVVASTQGDFHLPCHLSCPTRTHKHTPLLHFSHLSGHPINWIDAKNYFGSDTFFARKIRKQSKRFVARFGPGAVVFSLGHTSAIRPVDGVVYLTGRWKEWMCVWSLCVLCEFTGA